MARLHILDASQTVGETSFVAAVGQCAPECQRALSVVDHRTPAVDFTVRPPHLGSRVARVVLILRHVTYRVNRRAHMVGHTLLALYYNSYGHTRIAQIIEEPLRIIDSCS